MATYYAFQEIMQKKMDKEGWSQREVARRLSDVLKREIHAATITRLLAEKPRIPGGDVLFALAELFEADHQSFIASVFASRYAESDLVALSNFVRDEFQESDEADRRRILEILQRRQRK